MIKKIREKERESKKAHGKGKEQILEKTIQNGIHIERENLKNCLNI